MHSSEIPRVGTDAGANATAPESRARIATAMISIRGIMLILLLFVVHDLLCDRIPPPCHQQRSNKLRLTSDE